MTIGQRISRLRKRRGWTQEMFADKAGVHARHVSRWETDRMKPSGRTLKRLADLFGVPLDELLGEDQAGEAGPSLAALDAELVERLRQLHELEPQDRAMILRILDMLITQKQMQTLLSRVKEAS